MGKVRLATLWLDGCSGCHMSLLDIDERILLVAEKVDLVYGPLVDTKEFPENVDVVLVEGAVSSEEDLHKAKIARARSKVVVALGDCAVNSNVPAMRNQYRRIDIMQRAYEDTASIQTRHPDDVVPPLLPNALPLHQAVKVDYFLPGCPPSADLIFEAILRLLDGDLESPLENAHFG